MSEWQDISTAPEGVDILVCVTHSTGLSDDGSEAWETVYWVDAHLEDHGWIRFPFLVWVPFEPTHWMPLPDPPQ